MKFVFLGSGGGRFVTARQLRSTAGFQLTIDDSILHIDPGPGALLRYKILGLNPEKLDMILVSHNHPDHCTDALVLTEAMTGGASRNRGTLIVNQTFSQFIGEYHKKVPKNFVVMKPKDHWEDKVKIEGIPCEHGDEQTIGFLIKGKEGTIYYTSDTGLLPEHLQLKADVIVSNFTTIEGNGRMGIKEHVELARAVQPKKILITHFGLKVLKYGPELVAREIGKRAGLRLLLQGMV